MAGRVGVKWNFNLRFAAGSLNTVMALEREQSARAVIRLSPEAGRKDGTATDENGGKSSEEEKGHVTLAQMRARVDQQSTLIAMLKQRNDETFNEVSFILCSTKPTQQSTFPAVG